MLSKTNGSIRLVENSPCGSRADGGDAARGTLSLGAAEQWPLRWLTFSVTAPGRRAVGPSIKGSIYPARDGDRTAAVGRR